MIIQIVMDKLALLDFLDVLYELIEGDDPDWHLLSRIARQIEEQTKEI